MAALRDAFLWDHVRRTVARLGTPGGGMRPIPPSPPSPVVPRHVDLHGDSLQVAYERVRGTVRQARERGGGSVVVVTGLSGSIRVEFTAWAALNPDVVALEPLRGGGAFRLRVAERR